VKLATLALAALPLPGGDAAPTEFRILRAGMNRTEKGDFLFDEEAAESVMAAYLTKGLSKLQVDFEHQSMVPPPAGGPAEKPAAGWFKPEVRAGELWATEVAWTARAAAMLAPLAGAPEYRFFSPVLRFDEDTRRVRSLKNLALTNDPAMDDLHPLVAATARKDDDMPCEACAALTTKLSASEEECRSLKAKLSGFEVKDKDKDAAMTSLSGVRDKMVALTGQATEAGALGVLEAWKQKASRVDKLEEERATEVHATLTAEMKGVLDAAVKDGKLTPAMRPLEEKGALAFGAGKVSKEGVEYLTAKWGAAPKIVNPGGSGGPTQKETQTAVLTAEDVRVAKMFGNDVKDVEKFKTEQITAKARAALGA
jgi:phage I-like protein